MMYKRNIIFLLLIVCSFKLFSISFEQTKDLGKIRWIDCGEDLYEFSQIETMNFYFDIPESLNYYKVYRISEKNETGRGDGEIQIIKTGSFSVLLEYKKGFYIIRYDDSYMNYLNKRPEKFFDNNLGYLSDIKEDFSRVDNNDFNVKEICTKYVYKKNNNELLFIKELPNKTISGIVDLSDNNSLVYECGRHYIYFSNNAFKSDGTFYNSNDNEIIHSYGNDNFVIKILKYDENEKLLLLDTPSYTRPYVPMEDFFTPDTNKVIISKPYDKQKEMINCYPKPDFNSKSIKEIPGNKRYYVKIIEAKEKFEEYNNEISKWVKVKFDDGFESWVWGRDVTLFDWPTGYDNEKVKRYIQYNTVK